jgi:hypothetical protein
MMQKGTEMPKVTLYSYHLSSCSWRVRLALMLKGMFEKSMSVGFRCQISLLTNSNIQPLWP